VKVLLRYLIPVILAAIALVGHNYSSDLSLMISSNDDCDTELASSYSTSLFESDVLVHPNLTSHQAFRLQTTNKRPSNTYKNSLEFVKLGKRINTGVINLIQKKSLTSHSSFIKPYHRMICLGKLII
jgi:hypothetical protein